MSPDIGLVLRDAAYAAPQAEGIEPLVTHTAFRCLASPASHALSPFADADSIRCRETLNRLARVQANVMQLNDEHQALLRRSRRTVSALLNSYHSFAMTYSNPSTQSASTGEGL